MNNMNTQETRLGHTTRLNSSRVRHLAKLLEPVLNCRTIGMAVLATLAVIGHVSMPETSSPGRRRMLSSFGTSFMDDCRRNGMSRPSGLKGGRSNRISQQISHPSQGKGSKVGKPKVQKAATPYNLFEEAVLNVKVSNTEYHKKDKWTRGSPAFTKIKDLSPQDFDDTFILKGKKEWVGETSNAVLRYIDTGDAEGRFELQTGVLGDKTFQNYVLRDTCIKVSEEYIADGHYDSWKYHCNVSISSPNTFIKAPAQDKPAQDKPPQDKPPQDDETPSKPTVSTPTAKKSGFFGNMFPKW